MTRNDAEAFLPDPASLYDVIVAGGGPAGIGAAAASAKAGAKTLLLEARSVFGGVGQAALWMPWNRMLKDGASRGGAHALFCDAVRSYGPQAWTEGSTHNFLLADGLNIHPDFGRRAVFDVLEGQGCQYQLYSPVVGTVMEGPRLSGVSVSTKKGAIAYRAKVFVDATGDGDLARLSGVPMIKGRDDGTLMQPALVFALAEADYAAADDFLKNMKNEFHRIIGDARDAGYTTCEWYSFDRGSIPGIVSVNNGGIHGLGAMDGSDEVDLTLVQRKGIEAAVHFVEIARKWKIPGLANCALLRTGSHVAVRESWRITGEYIFTRSDAREGREFPDAVARKYGGIDDVGRGMETMKSGCAFPYRSLVPLKVDGLLVAGRCASATHGGFAAGRGMGNMMGLGQAAGAAAALCAREGTLPRSLDARLVRNMLCTWGVEL